MSNSGMHAKKSEPQEQLKLFDESDLTPITEAPLALQAPLIDPAKVELAEIAVERGVSGTFTYLVPKELSGRLTPGARVLVPFGAGRERGYYLGPRTLEVLEKEGIALQRLKSIVCRVDQFASLQERQDGQVEAPLLSAEMIELGRWIARNYVCALGTALAAMLPAGVKSGSSAQKERVVRKLKPDDELLALAEAHQKRSPKRSALMRALAQEPVARPVRDILERANVSTAVLKALEHEGLLEIVALSGPSLVEQYRAGQTANVAQRPELTEAQRQAVTQIEQAIQAQRQRVFLLQGVTGSGKTEVYLRALEQTFAQGRRAIVLVPEIALTPQTAERFEARLGRERIAVLHSHLTEGERAEAWRSVRAGQVQAVVGARSALFAPFDNVGCIVIDEEHEGAFKQESAPRYLAREVAIERARGCRAVVILGSATPSLEALHGARTGQILPLYLPDRVAGRTLPQVQIVDMRAENRETRKYNFISRRLIEALRETLREKEQAILFLNRRGFATVITCVKCGRTEHCPHCDITLTSHKHDRNLTCHYCGFQKELPSRCEGCYSTALKHWGLGTERVEDEVRRVFPAARIARMDSDTMTKRTSYLETLGAFGAGRIDILIGTQMIAKGLDFPNVTLVGIVLADTALHMPDFRSRERTYQLIAQVAGRAGRGDKPGRVLVQTHLPTDRAIRAAVTHDHAAFVSEELAERRRFYYPPFSRLARIVFRSRDKAKAQAAADGIGQRLKEISMPNMQVLGPAAASIEKLEDYYRYHILIKAPARETLAELFASGLADELNKLRGAEAMVDIDPLSMM